MPPGKRGRPAGSTTTSKSTAQKTLAFGPNSSNKITKPSPLSQSHTKKLSPIQKSALSTAVSEAEVSAPESPAAEQQEEEDVGKEEIDRKQAALPIRHSGQAEAKEAVERDQKELEALKVSEAQIKRYWKLKEEIRRAPRVHQQGLGVHEKVLREFDLSSQFGVSVIFSLVFGLDVWFREHVRGEY